VGNNARHVLQAKLRLTDLQQRVNVCLLQQIALQGTQDPQARAQRAQLESTRQSLEVMRVQTVAATHIRQ